MTAGSARGFSLVELLVVLAIVALLVSTVALSVGRGSDADAVALDLADDMIQLMGIASNRAVVMAQPIGMHIVAPEDVGERGWRVEWSHWRSGQWRIDTELAIQTELPKTVHVELWVEGRPVDLSRQALQSGDDTNDPVLVMYPTGETTPFMMQFSTQAAVGEAQVARLGSVASGAIEVQ